MTATLDVAPPPPKPPTDSGPCASATTWPPELRSGVASRVPPCRLRASPIDEAVTSTRTPTPGSIAMWKTDPCPANQVSVQPPQSQIRVGAVARMVRIAWVL